MTKLRVKRPIDNFRTMGIGRINLSKHLTPSVAGLTLFAFFALTAPLPGMAQVPTFSPLAPTTVTNPPPDLPYTLGAGDRVGVTIFDVPEYTGEYQVLVDGTLNLPVAGSIVVKGLSINEASERISQRYAPFVRRPLVTLTLIDARPLKIAVGGEVNRPGSYNVTLNEGQQFPSVTEVIQVAGGITRSADVRNVQIRRLTNLATRQRYTVNLWQLLQNGDLSQDVTLRDGDEIFIPTTTGIDLVESRQLATASFSAEAVKPIKVAVVGEVVRPGPYTVTAATSGAATADSASGSNRNVGGGSSTEPPTVTQAIQVAGGITQSADIRNVEVRRTTRDGSEQVIVVNLWDLLQEGNLAEDVILQQGDTIRVPEAETLTASEATELASASFSAAIINVNVVGEVQRAGRVSIAANSPLNQALLAAGGFDNRRARKSSVELIRLQPNGTVQKREIEVDFTADVNDQSNPPLRPNDVIIVRRSGFTRVTDTLGTIVSPVSNVFSILRFLGF